ncbi:MAG: glycosyltransferase [Anaerolineae bacterium]|nr:glycosyltransferase [Anaerolineae bacterium]
MKICMVTDTFWPRINGVSVSITALTNALRSLGHDVFIVAPDYSNLASRRKFIDGDTGPLDGVIRFPAHSLLFFPEDCSVNIVSPTYWRHVRRIRRMGFDIIHTHTPLMLGIVSMYWKGKQNARLVHTFHTLFEEFIPCYYPFCYLPDTISRRFSHWFSTNAFHWYCNQFDYIVAPSEQVADLLKGYYLTPPIDVVPTGIELDKFEGGNGERIRQEWGIAQNEKLLLFAGRVGFEKGIDLILNAMPRIHERIPNARLVIVGEGPALDALKKMAVELGIEQWVHFAGYKPHTEMADVYAAADLFLFASQTESQGLVTIEAMASGTPVVAVRGPGTLDQLKNETGGLLSPPDQDVFADQVIRLAQDGRLYERKVLEARQRAQDFSSQTMARSMLDIYESLLAAPPREPQKLIERLNVKQLF